MKIFMPMVLLSIFRKNKFKILKELSKSQWLSLSEIEEIQNMKFLKLINHCKKEVPYYQKISSLKRIKSLQDITKLPFLTKKIIKKNIESLKSTKYPKKYFISNTTSGSTGEILEFFHSKKGAMSFSVTMRNNMWTGWNIGERQITLWGSHYDISLAQKFFNKIKSHFFHRNIYLSAYDMTENDIFKYREKINKYKPQLITAYPTALFIFADFLERKGLSIYKPKGIISSAETLYEYQREKIESIFGCKVYNRYGCREVGDIAHECEEHKGLHINAEHIIVEVIGENGNPCKPGELGEIVITDLDNYVFPFIRYKIGDIGILSDKECSCGRGLPLLEEVEGRIFDIILGMNGDKLTGVFFSFLLRVFVSGIKQFQVIQESKDTLELKLIVDKNFNNETKEKIIKKIHEKCGMEMKVNIQLVDYIPLTKSGKHKLVISKVSPYIN